MDLWRSEALKTFPELQDQISRTEGEINGLGADIFSAMQAAYRDTPVKEDFIRKRKGVTQSPVL